MSPSIRCRLDRLEKRNFSSRFLASTRAGEKPVAFAGLLGILVFTTWDGLQ
jgi:hypothetical protein